MKIQNSISKRKIRIPVRPTKKVWDSHSKDRFIRNRTSRLRSLRPRSLRQVSHLRMLGGILFSMVSGFFSAGCAETKAKAMVLQIEHTNGKTYPFQLEAVKNTQKLRIIGEILSRIPAYLLEKMVAEDKNLSIFLYNDPQFNQVSASQANEHGFYDAISKQLYFRNSINEDHFTWAAAHEILGHAEADYLVYLPVLGLRWDRLGWPRISLIGEEGSFVHLVGQALHQHKQRQIEKVLGELDADLQLFIRPLLEYYGGKEIHPDEIKPCLEIMKEGDPRLTRVMAAISKHFVSPYSFFGDRVRQPEEARLMPFEYWAEARTTFALNPQGFKERDSVFYEALQYYRVAVLNEESSYSIGAEVNRILADPPIYEFIEIGN